MPAGMTAEWVRRADGRSGCSALLGGVSVSGVRVLVGWELQ